VTRVAAIDMGTNSTRLLVADIEGSGRAATVTTIDRRMTITRLGQGVDADRRLHPDAIERTLAALAEYGDVARGLGAERVRAVATSAARDAANRDALFDPAIERLGVRPELISGTEEAELSFLGATADLGGDGAPYLVIDIGGGSTEFVAGIDVPDASISIDMGCVRLTEQFLASDPPRAEELSAAIGYVRDQLGDVDRAVPGAATARTVVGLAGTVSTIAAVEQGLATYDRDRIHGFRLTRAATEECFRVFATESRAQRRHNPGLEPGRVDVIVGGAIVLVSVMRHWDLDEVLVSESDILDGLARRLAE
jgi:exopolyphosphatase/guanosine-5'-triphosphate,3'-diphosphate pyrophosphatase